VQGVRSKQEEQKIENNKKTIRKKGGPLFLDRLLAKACKPLG
jgi:hypothetical protein